MTRSAAFAAVDLGADSGRVMVGEVADASVELRTVHRFHNRPVRLPDGVHWNILGLLRDVLDGLAAADERRLSGIGIDAWGVDYGLLDDRDRLLGLPFHYRDRRTEGLPERAFERISRHRMFESTGIQTLPINTAFQLIADQGTAMLDAAQSLALIPDLLAFWLCGELANEATVASTTGLLAAGAGGWSYEVIDALGLPRRLFRELAEPGTELGAVAAHHAEEARLDHGVPVFSVAGHDTASAFVGAPLGDGAHAAILCSGTWSLLGVELREPLLTEEALAINLTNERGIDGTIRLLKNVMGLWLVQECRRAWGSALSYEELDRLAADTGPAVALFDPDREEFLAPGDMPRRIAEACRQSGQDPPEGRGETIRSVLVSLACKYRFVLEHLERATGNSLDSVHLVGGGARSALLCQITADLLGRVVLAGPVEASAWGNVLVQARAAGLLDTLQEMRAAVASCAAPDSFEPHPGGQHEEIYNRFLDLTGLMAPAVKER